jgi:hypothetical protein
MENQVNNFVKAIENLAYLRCEGCQKHFASFNDHTCHVYDWFWKVSIYFEEAIDYLQLKREDLDLEEIKSAVLNV